MTLTMVSSFNLLMVVVNGHKELSHSVSNQWPHINIPLLPPQRGNYTALLPPLLIMCLRQFFCMRLREKSTNCECGKKDSGQSRINRKSDWVVAHRPFSPRGLKLLFIYLFFEQTSSLELLPSAFHGVSVGLVMHCTGRANWVKFREYVSWYGKFWREHSRWGWGFARGCS